MNDGRPSADATLDPEHSAQLASCYAQFDAAWREALKGSPPPDLQTFVHQAAEPVRATLQRELEPVHQRYQQQLARQLGELPADTTLDLGMTPLPDRREGIPGTLEYASGQDEGLDAAFSLAEGFTASKSGPSPLVPGYEIVGELGRGGMGVVYKARHLGLNRWVALKMVLAGAHADPLQLARFHTEAEAVGRLQHPNIVQIYDVGECQGLPYFSLEFVDGGSLAEKVHRQPQPPRDAAHLIETLARAMYHAHQQDIIHRDLKPANILLSRDGIPKITDFGLAKRLEGDASQTKSGTLMGTPSYMAPEQARGEIQKVGPLADVYALGAILYELLTGRPPFLAATPMETVLQVSRDEPTAPTRLHPKIPRDLETICLKCLEKDPRKRYPSAHELAEDLRRFLAAEPIHARSISAPERLWRWCVRNPRVAVLSGLVMLLLVMLTTGSLIFAWRLAQERAEVIRQAELAENRRAEAEANAKVAQEQSNLAVKSLYSVVVGVQNQLRDRPDMQKLRGQLLEDAMTGMKSVVKASENSNLLDRTQGGAYQRMGDLALELGRSEEAMSDYQQALKIFQELAKQDPQDDVGKWNLAVLYHKVGGLSHQLHGDPQQTRDYYQRATGLREALLAGPRREPRLTPVLIQNALAESYASQAELALLLGNPAEAREHYQKAMKLQEALASATGAGPQAKEALAFTYVTVGTVSFRLRDMEGARRYFQKSLDLRKDLAAADGNSVSYQRALADSYTRLGDLLLQIGKPEELAAVLQLYQTAHNGQKKLFERNQASAELRHDLAGSYYRLGTAHLRVGQTELANQDFEHCLELRELLAREDSKNQYKQVELALAQARCGRHHVAAAGADALRPSAANDPSILFHLACTYSLCISAVSDGPEANPDSKALKDRYTKSALETLEQAFTHGYQDLVSVELDPDLTPLRSQPGFADLIQKLTHTRVAKRAD